MNLRIYMMIQQAIKQRNYFNEVFDFSFEIMSILKK